MAKSSIHFSKFYSTSNYFYFMCKAIINAGIWSIIWYQTFFILIYFLFIDHKSKVEEHSYMLNENWKVYAKIIKRSTMVLQFNYKNKLYQLKSLEQTWEITLILSTRIDILLVKHSKTFPLSKLSQRKTTPQCQQKSHQIESYLYWTKYTNTPKPPSNLSQ